MNGSKKILFLFLVLALGVSSCLKPEEFSTDPVITFKSAEIINDSLIFKIAFTDGDGDIGLNDFDTVSPYNIDGNFYYNLFVDYYEKVNGSWVKSEMFGGAEHNNFRIPLLTPSGQNKALKGEIKAVIEPIPGPNNTSYPIYYNIVSPDSDTIQYRFRLADRALNVSNEVVTQEIYHD